MRALSRVVREHVQRLDFPVGVLRTLVEIQPATGLRERNVEETRDCSLPREPSTLDSGGEVAMVEHLSSTAAGSRDGRMKRGRMNGAGDPGSIRNINRAGVSSKRTYPPLEFLKRQSRRIQFDAVLDKTFCSESFPRCLPISHSGAGDTAGE